MVGLAIQYALGMAINLFVEFPSESSPHALWDFTLHNALIMSHLALGTLIVFGAAAMVVRTSRKKAVTWKIPATAGLACVLIAWAAGDAFISLQAEALSYLMSLAFLLAMFSYAWGVYRSNRSEAK